MIENDEQPDNLTFDNFIKLIVGGSKDILNRKIKASILVKIQEQPNDALIVNYGNQVSCEKIKNADNYNTDLSITMPINTLNRIYNEYEYLDWREPEIIGTIVLEGDWSLANHFAKSLLRPTKETQGIFAYTDKLHKKNNYQNLKEIKILENPSQIKILDAIEKGLPLLIKSLGKDSKYSDWDLDKLVKRYGNTVVSIRSATEKMTMLEFVSKLKNFINSDQKTTGDFVKLYTEGAPLPYEMWDDFGPLFFNREDYTPPQLWFGAVPSNIPTSSLHRDPRTGFLFQVIGKKKLDLYSSDQENLLYPMVAYNNYQSCLYEPEKKDFVKFPKAKKAKHISVVLESGDLIIQPAGWFHQVHTETNPNMSVSYFWRYNKGFND